LTPTTKQMLQSRVLANLAKRTSQWPATNERLVTWSQRAMPVVTRCGCNSATDAKGLSILRTSLHGAIFEPLRNRERFAQLYLDCELATIAWEHGADFAAEYLYEKLATVH
jgi:hypothetical protein